MPARRDLPFGGDPADEFHSPYCYVGNDPVNFVDPDGMNSENTVANVDNAIDVACISVSTQMALGITGLGDVQSLESDFAQFPGLGFGINPMQSSGLSFDLSGHIDRAGMALDVIGTAASGHYAIYNKELGVMMGNLNGKKVWYGLNGANQYKFGVEKVAASVKGITKISNACSYLSIGISAYQMYDAYKRNDNTAKIMAGGDLSANVIGTFGWVGALYNASYNLGKYVVAPPIVKHFYPNISPRY